MAKATHKIVATVGKYTDRQTGEEKKRYLQCGVAFTDDQGRISLKIDAMPVTPDWSGFLSLYPLDDERERQPVTRSGARKYPGDGRSEAPGRSRPPAAAESESIAEGMEDDDIPF